MLTSGMDLIVSMFDQDVVEYLHIDPKLSSMRSGYTVLEFTSCIGSQEINFFRDPTDEKTKFTSHKMVKMRGGR